MAKKPTLFGLATRVILLLAELSCASSAYFTYSSGGFGEDGAEFLTTAGAFWIGLSVLTWIFSTVAGWVGMSNVVKKAGWGLFGTLLGGPILFIWMLLDHVPEFFRYLFAYFFGGAAEAPANATKAPANATKAPAASNNTAARAPVQKQAADGADTSDRRAYVRAIEAALDEIGVPEFDFSVPGGYAYPVKVERCNLRFRVPYAGGTICVEGEIGFGVSGNADVEGRKRKIEEDLHRDVENAVQKVNARYPHAYPQYHTWDVKYYIKFNIE